METTTCRRKLLIRRLGRHLFTAASALSFVLFVVSGGLRIRQRYWCDEWVWVAERRTWPSSDTQSPPDNDMYNGRPHFVTNTKEYTVRSFDSVMVVSFERHRESRLYPSPMLRTLDTHFRHETFLPTQFTPPRVGLPYHYTTYLPVWLAARGLLVTTCQYDFNNYAFSSVNFGHDSGTWVMVAVPTLFIATLSALLPAIWAASSCRSRRRMYRQKRRLCLACGYDLRATPDRCPECGVEATAKRA